MLYKFPGCEVRVDEHRRYVETRFPDGARVGSTPNADEHTLNVAAELGYGTDTFAMSRDHELAHSWLAYQDGRVASPTMWRLAHPEAEGLPDDVEVSQEEARVLAFQKALDKSSPPPWDLAEIPEKHPLAW